MSTSISDYVCNLIAGRSNITNLYYAVDRARDQRSNGKTYCFKVVLPGIGNKLYRGNRLVELDDRATCSTMSYLLSQINGTPTVDQLVLVLLKAKNELRNLYQARQRALYIRSAAKIFCYTFNNPFGTAAGVNKNKLSFRNANDFLSFFCKCERNSFDATLILAGLE